MASIWQFCSWIPGCKNSNQNPPFLRLPMVIRWTLPAQIDERMCRNSPSRVANKTHQKTDSCSVKPRHGYFLTTCWNCLRVCATCRSKSQDVITSATLHVCQLTSRCGNLQPWRVEFARLMWAPFFVRNPSQLCNGNLQLHFPIILGVSLNLLYL